MSPRGVIFFTLTLNDVDNWITYSNGFQMEEKRGGMSMYCVTNVSFGLWSW